MVKHEHDFKDLEWCEDCGKKQCVVVYAGQGRCLKVALKNGYCRDHQDKVPTAVKFAKGLAGNR